MVLVVILLLVALLLPAVRTARPAARRMQCVNQLKQLALARLNYHDLHGSFPLPATQDEAGRDLHSWRTLLLPHLEEQTLFDRLDLASPWDSEANRAQWRDESLGRMYVCPSLELDVTATTYLAVVGPDAPFVRAEPRMLADFDAGGARTIGTLDADLRHAVPWPQPVDLSVDDAADLRLAEQQHPPGVLLAAFLDGHVEALQAGLDEAAFRAMLTGSTRDAPPAGARPPAE